jgi:hypothetical protein
MPIAVAPNTILSVEEIRRARRVRSADGMMQARAKGNG